MYVLSSFDNFPGNQWGAIQTYEPNYLFFIVFAIFNLFLFTTIPGTLVYTKIRSTYSKLILLDELRQQHSLVLAFVTLARKDHSLHVSTLVHFLNFLYRHKVRYVDLISDICTKIDENSNRSVVLPLSLSKSLSS